MTSLKPEEITLTFVPWQTTSNSPPFPTQGTLTPALTPRVELALNVTYIALYGLLFLMVYIQLWMILFYRHKRLSYQTVFLYLCLVWSGLRTTLFAFYFNDCSSVNLLHTALYWLLFCFPVCLQFIVLCLLVLFFAQVVFKARAKYEPSKFKTPLKVMLVISVLVFFVTNITSAVITRNNVVSYNLSLRVLFLRVAINDTLFIILGVVLCVCIYKMAKMASATVVLEAKGTSICQAMTACVLIVLLYTSRAVYNLVAVCPISQYLPNFGYSWVNVTDQADFVHLDVGFAFLSFGIVLFVWEILPMFIVILFFRVKRLGAGATLKDLPSHRENTNAYFFDNPRRYDSEEDLSHSEISTPNHLQPAVSNSYSINTDGTPKGSPYGSAGRQHRFGYGAVVHSSGLYSGASPAISNSSMAGYQSYYDGT